MPYEEIKEKKVKLPKRQKPGDYEETKHPFKYVAEKF